MSNSSEEIPVYLRTASKRDLPRVRALLIECWHATYDVHYGPERVADITGRWHSVAMLEKQLKAPGSEFVLADTGDEILGMVYAILQGEIAFIKQMYVRPNAQGMGLGRMMMHEVENCFDDAQAIQLEVEALNNGAISFYHKLGFQQAGRSDRCNGETGFDTLVMRKAL